MKKKICFVNCSSGGSTGNIIKNLASFCADDFEYCYILGDKINNDHALSLSYTPFKYKIARLQTFLFGNDGFLSLFYRNKIRKFLEIEKPDLIHLHNVHRSFCNLEVIFNYALKHNIKIVWTLHDEWILTGRCCYSQECKKWVNGCSKCEHKDYYPKSLFDHSSKFYKKKRHLIDKVKSNLVLVTPSKWLNDEVKCFNVESYVFNNGIDTTVFKPTTPNSKILKNANGRIIVGGAALFFNSLKGGDTFKQLADKLDPTKYFIVLIGSEKQEIEYIKDNFVIMPKTSSIEEMASFYSSLDVFINPTKADNYPTTHLESISCGTPVISFDVGGATEMIKDGETGFSVKYSQVDDIISKIEFISRNRSKFERKDIEKKSNFSRDVFCTQYRDLYLKLLKR